MKTLFRLFIVGFLLALLCLALQSPLAHAQTSTAVYPSPPHAQGTVTYLERGTRGRYYFSPTYIYCQVYRPCVTIINVTGRAVLILDQDNSVVSNLWNGKSTGAITLYHPGIYRYTDVRQNVRVPLMITVSGGYWRGGPTECGRDCMWRRYRS